MWTSGELKKLQDCLADDTLESLCTDDEIKIIGENSMRLVNLRNALFVPRHAFPVI